VSAGHGDGPRFSVGERVSVVNRAGEIMIRSAIVVGRHALPDGPPVAHDYATGRDIEWRGGATWGYRLAGDDRPWLECALRPLPDPLDPAATGAAARPRELEPA